MAYPYKPYPKKTTTQSASDKYKNYKWGQIAVTVQPGKGPDLKTKQPYKVINLYNIDEQSAQDIIARLTDPSKQRVTRTAWVDKKEPTHVQIKVFDSEIDQWLDGGDLNAIQSVLFKSGKYDNNEVSHIEDEIAIGFKSSNKELAQQVYNDANDNAMNMWQKYLSTINDPVTRAQLELYARVYGNVSYGHTLSINNASLIKSVDPDATFVLAPSKWREFGRGIKRNAKPLPLWVWVPNSDASNKDFEDAKNSNGWEGTNNQDLSLQVKNDLAMKANKSGGFTLRKIGYDVRDTYLLSGAKEDPWTTQIGLLNNLSSQLNAAAQQDQAQRNMNKEPIEGADEMMKRTEKACAWMENFCQTEGYKAVSNYQDASNKLADYLLEYCKVNATKRSNILKEANANVYAENATQIVLIITKLGLNALQRFHSKYEYDKKEATALMNVVFGIAKKLEENAVLDEGLFDWMRDKAQFVKLFLQALKQIGCRIINKPQEQEQQPQEPQAEQDPNNIPSVSEVKENFYRVFNKINAEIF